MPRQLEIGSLLTRLGIDARQRGREWYARCPNPEHEDRNPSWRIRDELGSPRHGKHHCWSCGFKGDAVGLAAHLLGVAREAAEEWVGGAEAADRPVPVGVLVREVHANKGFRIPGGVDFGPLEAWPTMARVYAESRGITAEQVARWGIGYSVEGRLAGRLVVVRRDQHGAPTGYTARTFVDDRRRYLEPEPWERPLPAMFGEQHWPPRGPLRIGPVYRVEGAINALAIERALGPVCVAATSGSEMMVTHVLRLATWGEVVDVSDPDEAGDKSAGDLAPILERAGVRVRRARLPDGVDAAEADPVVLAACLTQAWV